MYILRLPYTFLSRSWFLCALWRLADEGSPEEIISPLVALLVKCGCELADTTDLTLRTDSTAYYRMFDSSSGLTCEPSSSELRSLTALTIALLLSPARQRSRFFEIRHYAETSYEFVLFRVLTNYQYRTDRSTRRMVRVQLVELISHVDDWEIVQMIENWRRLI